MDVLNKFEAGRGRVEKFGQAISTANAVLQKGSKPTTLADVGGVRNKTFLNKKS